MARIAAVDADDTVTLMLRASLRLEGHQVDEFNDLVGFYEDYVPDRWDVIIVDVPDGCSFVEGIREVDEDVAIILMRTLDSGDYEAEVDLYLLKPFRPLVASRAVWDLVDEEPSQRIERLHSLLERLRLLS